VRPRTSRKHRESHGAQRMFHCLLSFIRQTQNERKPFLFRRCRIVIAESKGENRRARARTQSGDEILCFTDSAKWRPFLAQENVKRFFALHRFTIGFKLRRPSCCRVVAKSQGGTSENSRKNFQRGQSRNTRHYDLPTICHNLLSDNVDRFVIDIPVFVIHARVCNFSVNDIFIKYS